MVYCTQLRNFKTASTKDTNYFKEVQQYGEVRGVYESTLARVAILSEYLRRESSPSPVRHACQQLTTLPQMAPLPA